ncbi:hypothetical protein BDN71DRAFT_1432802 [Pleurotus eryngii]|uniref:Uncharacterized protein n=1 Tax=Pleurotus eryngii TaxID=5323 RepID=A0A9P5ZS54_PLEER|nr:hypothetical protein BDN71DRAFT_1432802 [Pleurotus eryngii]
MTEGKLDTASLAKVLWGYSNNPKLKGLLEEEALVQLTIGYRNVCMEDLEIKKELGVITKIELLKIRIFESEKGSVGLLEGIILTMAELWLTIDWQEIPYMLDGKKWKKAHHNKLFEFQW